MLSHIFCCIFLFHILLCIQALYKKRCNILFQNVASIINILILIYIFYIVYFSYVGIQILKFLKNLTKAIAIFLFMCYVLSIVSITCFYSCITLTRELVTVFHNRIKGASGHCTGTEWGEKPREWVTVMPGLSG